MTETASRDDETSGHERVEREDGVQVTGLLGTIRQEQVTGALQPRANAFMRCLEPRLSTVAQLSGDIRLAFRIRTDGTVAWVYPSSSTIGDREAERCILDVAARVRFPQPSGGEAEFTWGFAFDPPEDVRPPIVWDATAIRETLRANAADLGSRCGAHGVEVTAYIAPGGRVITAGAATPDAETLARVDCVIEAVRGLPMPDPGSYAAKVTFRVQ